MCIPGGEGFHSGLPLIQKKGNKKKKKQMETVGAESRTRRNKMSSGKIPKRETLGWKRMKLISDRRVNSIVLKEFEDPRGLSPGIKVADTPVRVWRPFLSPASMQMGGMPTAFYLRPLGQFLICSPFRRERWKAREVGESWDALGTVFGTEAPDSAPASTRLRARPRPEPVTC